MGGARNYVEKIIAGIDDKHLNTPVVRIEHLPGAAAGSGNSTGSVRIHTASGSALFDRVVIATHSDQALGLLAQPSAAERATLGAIRYQSNLALLHTDASVLPHYLLNRLQPLPWEQPVLVTLNPLRPLDESQVLGRYHYAHPVFDLPAVAAQARMPQLQGHQRRYFAGAWMGYGFHEDGLKAGLAAAEQLLADHHGAGTPA